jgi:hypothetical protein
MHASWNGKIRSAGRYLEGEDERSTGNSEGAQRGGWRSTCHLDVIMNFTGCRDVFYSLTKILDSNVMIIKYWTS